MIIQYSLTVNHSFIMLLYLHETEAQTKHSVVINAIRKLMSGEAFAAAFKLYLNIAYIQSQSVSRSPLRG